MCFLTILLVHSHVVGPTSSDQTISFVESNNFVCMVNCQMCLEMSNIAMRVLCDGSHGLLAR